MQNRQYMDKRKGKDGKYKNIPQTTFPSTVELGVCQLYHLRRRSCVSLQIDLCNLYLMDHGDGKKQMRCQAE